MTELILAAAAALLAGIAIGWLAGKGRAAAAEARLAAERDFHTRQLEALRTQHAEAAAAERARFDETLARVTAQLQTATAAMLRERQQEFAQSSGESLERIVGPLRETIGEMRKAMDDSTLRQTAMSSEMKAGVESIMRQSEAARRSTEELARVFRHGAKVQGDWGEAVLDELLHAQGLTRGIHYDTQTALRDADGTTVKSDGGTTLRPDVILHLDSRRELIIDSKVSLSAFIDYVNADDEATRAKALRAHVESLRKHVRELAAKDYSAYVQPPKLRMDYVIMFVPNTGALWTALHACPDLWRRAMEQNVFIADEQTLFAALRIISLTWTQITQAQQHEKVYRLAEEMLDRVGQFAKRYDAIGRALAAAQKAYDDGARKLAPTGQSIIATARKLTDLGAKESARNPLPKGGEEAEGGG